MTRTTERSGGIQGRAAAAAVLLGGLFCLIGGGPLASASTTAPCKTSQTSICLTSHAGYHVEHARVGNSVTLTLTGSAEVWSAPSLSGSGLVKVGQPIAVGRGFIAHYRASRTGLATLQATERPYCPPGMACPAYVLLWRAQVKVSS